MGRADPPLEISLLLQELSALRFQGVPAVHELDLRLHELGFALVLQRFDVRLEGANVALNGLINGVISLGKLRLDFDNVLHHLLQPAMLFLRLVGFARKLLVFLQQLFKALGMLHVRLGRSQGLVIVLARIPAPAGKGDSQCSQRSGGNPNGARKRA